MFNRDTEYSHWIPNKVEYGKSNNLPALFSHVFLKKNKKNLEISAYHKHEQRHSHISLYKCMGYTSINMYISKINYNRELNKLIGQ